MATTPTFSAEFFPPRDNEGELRLWEALATLSQLNPNFVSVTYGAGGSNRDRTIRVTGEITSRTGISTVAHLTCVGATKDELTETLDSYRKYGIKSILALRGDPEGGPRANWVTTPGGFNHSDELVSLAVAMGFEVGVAAFPDIHPASKTLEQDVAVLLEKERRGASFATTQFFFSIDRYVKLRDALRAAGSKLPIIPGILPITNFKQLDRMAQLIGAEIPQSITERILPFAENPDRVKQIGIEIAVELCEALLKLEVPGLHFYTMNSAVATMQIVQAIGLR